MLAALFQAGGKAKQLRFVHIAGRPTITSSG